MKHCFYHITDSHYFSKKNYGCDPWSLPQWPDQISFRESEEILKKALQIILDDGETNTVIFTGDLTNHGDEFSHRELVELLSEFESKGGNPYVVTDTHDYPWFEIFRIDENGQKAEKEHLPREEVVPMYYPFGRSKALDTFTDDTTYIAEILPQLRYIALGYDMTDSGPAFSDELMEWISVQAEKAKKDGCTVICGVHLPLVTPSPIYDILGKGNTFVNGEQIAKRFADMGINFCFTGHTHIQCMKESVSDSGNKLYHVQTSALSGYPPKMRKITIDTDSDVAQIRTVDMEVPELNLGMPLAEYCRNGFLGSIENIPYNMEHDVEAFAETGGGVTLPKDLIRKHPKIVSFIGRKINGLTYGKMARFSKKYHAMEKSEYANIENEKVVPFLFDLVAYLYTGNASIAPDSVEHKIAIGVVKKAERITKTLHVDLEKMLGSYSLVEIVEPLLYNSGLDDDNVDVRYKKGR